MNELKSALRMNLLKAMDDYIREGIGDDNITETWLGLGIADGDAETEEGLEEYLDDEIFKAMVTVFNGCCNRDK